MATKVKRTAEGGAFYVPCSGPAGDGKGCVTKSGQAIAHATPVGMLPRCKGCQRLSGEGEKYLGYLKSRDDAEKVALLGTLWGQRAKANTAAKAERAAQRKAGKASTVARKGQQAAKATAKGQATAKATAKAKRPAAKSA